MVNFMFGYMYRSIVLCQREVMMPLIPQQITPVFVQMWELSMMRGLISESIVKREKTLGE